MNTIYNHHDLMMQADEECIVIHNFGIQLIEMTKEEYINSAIAVLKEFGYEVVEK